ncbi:hypothetical protein KY308_02640 [Candidatus Woesearchaeota archaeon]|nr:hypothetical protein [Candidatus Woesearchaeota archaeon]
MVLDKIFKKGKKKKTAKKQTKKVAKPKKEQVLDIDRDVWPIKAVAILEILGAPKEHVQNTLNAYIEKLKQEKDLKVEVVHISEPEEKDKLFGIYAEIEMYAKKPSRLTDFCFDYMPSSIELLEPERIHFDSHAFSNFFNDLQARLHQVDMAVKKLTAENKLLSQNAHLILRNNILLSLRESDKDLKAISRNIGIPEEKTKIFLDALVQKGFLVLKKGKYSIDKNKVTFHD